MPNYARFDGLDDFETFYREEIAPALRVDPNIDTEPDCETPTYARLKSNFSGFVERLRRDHDLSPAGGQGSASAVGAAADLLSSESNLRPIRRFEGSLVEELVEDVQRECLDRLDGTRSPEAVPSCLKRAIKLAAGEVAVDQFVERNRVSKPLEGYTRTPRTWRHSSVLATRTSPSTPDRTSNTSSSTRNPRATVSP